MPQLIPYKPVVVTAVGQVAVPNPDDGTTTYSQIELSRSPDNSAWSVVATFDITAREEQTPYTDAAGTATSYYKYRYKTAAAAFSEFSPSIQAGDELTRQWIKTDMGDTNITNTIWDQWISMSLQDMALHDIYKPSAIQSISPSSTTTEWYDLNNDIKRAVRVDIYDGSNFVTNSDLWLQSGRQIRIFYPATNLTYKVYGLAEMRTLADLTDEAKMLLYWMLRVRYLDYQIYQRTNFKIWGNDQNESNVSLPQMMEARNQAQLQVDRRILALRSNSTIPANSL